MKASRGETDRGLVVVIAIVVAALGLFALKFVSGNREVAVSGEREGGARQWQFAGAKTRVSASDWASGGERLSVRSDVKQRHGAGRLREDLRRSGPGSGAVDRYAPGRTVRQSARRGRSTIGTSSSARRFAAGSSVHLAPTELRAGARKRGSARSAGGRDELVAALAAAPASQRSLLDSGGAPDPNNDEVVLSVDSVEDASSKASESDDVEQPDFGEGIKLNPDSVLSFPDAGNVNGDAGTMTVDFEANWAGSDETNNTLAQIREPDQWNNRFELVKNGQYLRFIITDSTGIERDISYRIDSWLSGERHKVTPTWGDGQMRLFVDGRLVGQNEYPGKLEIRAGTPMHLGSSFGNFKGLDGTIHQATVFGSAKTAAEIQGMP